MAGYNEYFVKKDGKFLCINEITHISDLVWVDTPAEATSYCNSMAIDLSKRIDGSKVFPPGDCQVLRMCPEKLAKIRSGDTVMAIMLSMTDFELSGLIFHDTSTGNIVDVEVLRVTHCRLRNIPHVDMVLLEAKSHEVLLEEIRNTYPEFTEDDVVTLLRFEVVK